MAAAWLGKISNCHNLGLGVLYNDPPLSYHYVLTVCLLLQTGQETHSSSPRDGQGGLQPKPGLS